MIDNYHSNALSKRSVKKGRYKYLIGSNESGKKESHANLNIENNHKPVVKYLKTQSGKKIRKQQSYGVLLLKEIARLKLP